MAEPAPRPHPFAVAFAPFVPDRFAAIRAGLAEAGVEPFDRDAWVLSRPGAEFLRDLRPDGGLGDAVEELLALAHGGYLFWQEGQTTIHLERDELDRLLGTTPAVREGSAGPGRAAYFVWVAPRRVWGTPVEGAPAEPLEGWFAVVDGNHLSAAAVFGLLPGRLGFTVVHTAGPAPERLLRSDGTAAFAPVLDGGQAAGLWSLTGQEELLDFAWRVHRTSGMPADPPPAGQAGGG